MGRHGGGSRSGGSRSSSSSRSSGGSGGTTSSSRPFVGSYRRSYYRGTTLVEYYTTDKNFGKKPGLNVGTIILLAFIAIHMCCMMTGVLQTAIQHGEPINGDKQFIEVVDKIDILSEKDEADIKRTLYKVYEKSGMPVAFYTDNFDYTQYYSNIELYSEDIYYSKTLEEDCMLMLLTVDLDSGFTDWNFDFYCGDDTYDCLSDSEFDELIEAFMKAMYQNDIVYAVEYAWDTVMSDLASTEINYGGFLLALPVLGIYSLFYIPIIKSIRNRNAAYKYFKEHPEELVNETWQGTLGSKVGANTASTEAITCRWCGTKNSAGAKTCSNCRSNLEV